MQEHRKKGVREFIPRRYSKGVFLVFLIVLSCRWCDSKVSTCLALNQNQYLNLASNIENVRLKLAWDPWSWCEGSRTLGEAIMRSNLVAIFEFLFLGFVSLTLQLQLV
jgi:hypothetical protein